MSNHISELFVDVRGRMILVAAVSVAMGVATAAWPQQTQPQLQVAPSQQAVPPAAAPAPPAPERSNPGLIEEFGKLLKEFGVRSQFDAPDASQPKSNARGAELKHEGCDRQPEADSALVEPDDGHRAHSVSGCGQWRS